MSSTAESLKQAADGAAMDEPSPKKAKTSETDKSVDATNEKGAADNNNIGKKTPSKASNGTDKESHADGDHAGEKNDERANETGASEGVFDPKITASLEQVESIQLEICNLNEKASEEILKVEQKFNKLRRPHFEKRNDLLKDIPNFWLTSMANHPMIAPMIESAEDEDCLHYMVNLDVEEYEDIKSGYKLKLHFNENPYIANKVLVKEFQIVSSEEVVSGSTPIEYKNTNQGKALKRVVENSVAHYSRSRRPGQAAQSFFAWFTEPTESGTDEIADILKDQIWPNPLEFFFAAPEDYGATSDDDESEDLDEDIDDEEIDDEEEDGVIVEEGCELYSDDDDLGEEGEEDDDEDVE